MSGMGIYVSSGSACSKGHKSPVLTAMGLSDDIINSSLRVSLSKYTTEEELNEFVLSAEKALKTLAKRR
jgi:cysteine desulfurase